MISLYDFCKLTIRLRYAEFIEQLRHSDVADAFKLAARRITESTGYERLTVTRSSFKNNEPTFIYVLTGSKAKHFCLVEMSVLYVFNALHCSSSSGEMCIADIPVQFVALSPIPLAVNEKSQALLKTKQ